MSRSLAEISSLSTEYVEVPIRHLDTDPTTYDVDMAFKTSGEPELADWVTSIWETRGTSYIARCLVGPEGSTQLDDGSYDVWVRITATPELPHIKAGRLRIS